VKKILIATTNPGKIAEIKLGLKELEKRGFEILTLNDLPTKYKDPEETGKTFQENVLIKAKFYGDSTGLPCLSDDGGLIIPYLNNEPGVKSKRWLGRDASDEELIKYTLERLAKVPQKDRKAHFQSYLCLYDPKIKRAIFETEKISGHIAQSSSAKRIAGFPFRSLLIVDKFNKFYDELSPEEHLEVNHRLIALKRLVMKIKNMLL
jgi:XTP/dITP diphosphohydrolase